MPRPSSVTSTPSERSESIVVRIGRRRADASPSNPTGPSARAATGGMNRMTVPASPQSIDVPPESSPGVTSRSGPNTLFEGTASAGTSSICTPSDRSASIMSAESRECSGARSSDGPSARAASTSSRLVRLFEPGSRMDAASGPRAVGATHGPGSGACRFIPSSYGLNSGPEYGWTSIGYSVSGRLETEGSPPHDDDDARLRNEHRSGHR